jgi:hypothetical protein
MTNWKILKIITEVRIVSNPVSLEFSKKSYIVDATLMECLVINRESKGV